MSVPRQVRITCPDGVGATCELVERGSDRLLAEVANDRPVRIEFDPLEASGSLTGVIIYASGRREPAEFVIGTVVLSALPERAQQIETLPFREDLGDPQC